MEFCSFYDAWKYLTENEMFFDDYGQFCVDDCFRMTVEKNETNKSNEKNKIIIWCRPFSIVGYPEKFGDNDGTVVGSGFTFEEAMIDLAKNVYCKYDFNENEEGDFDDDDYDYTECDHNCDCCNDCDNGYNNNNNDNDDDYYEDDCDGNCNDCDGCDDYDYYLDNLSNQNYSDKDGLNKNLEKFYKNNLNKKLRVLKGIIDLLIEE